jgi:hypothetical protein
MHLSSYHFHSSASLIALLSEGAFGFPHTEPTGASYSRTIHASYTPRSDAEVAAIARLEFKSDADLTGALF